MPFSLFYFDYVCLPRLMRRFRFRRDSMLPTRRGSRALAPRDVFSPRAAADYFSTPMPPMLTPPAATPYS
jgi:hypothetical protein